MQSIAEILARELEKPLAHVQNVIHLLDEGNTIPFIARYRKELHGSMDDTALRTLEDRLNYLRNLAQRREEVKNAIDGQGKLTQELSAAIDNAATLAEVEDLYRPYKQKRRTRATVARVRQPLAAHTRHQGSRISWAGRRSSVQMALLYQLWYAALSFRRVCLGGGRCLSHQPSRVSSGQPGWRQGRRARLAMGYHLHVCKNKNAGTSNPPLWVFTGSGVLRSGLWQYPLAWRSYSPGSKSPGSPPWCLAGCAAVAGFFGTPGTQAIRLSLSTVYHESQGCAILFPPFLHRCEM